MKAAPLTSSPRKLAPLVIAPLVFLAAFLGGYMAGEQVSRLASQQALRVELEIKVNGETVYYDPDDPATLNLAYMLAAAFAPDPNTLPSITDFSGATISGYYPRIRSDGYDPPNDLGNIYPPHIILTDLNQTITRDIFTLSGNLIRVAPIATIADNGTNLVITISASYTFSTTYNLAMVGLTIRFYDQVWVNAPGEGEILVFVDDINPDISVNVGDTVTIIYRILIP